MNTALRAVGLGFVLLLAVAGCGDDAADPERFCEIDAEFEELGDPFEAAPDEARVLLAEGRALLDEFVDVAPQEIRSSVEIQVDAFTPFFDLFEAADFDAARIDETELEALWNVIAGEAGAAIDAVEQWVEENCTA